MGAWLGFLNPQITRLRRFFWALLGFFNAEAQRRRVFLGGQGWPQVIVTTEWSQ